MNSPINRRNQAVTSGCLWGLRMLNFSRPYTLQLIPGRVKAKNGFVNICYIYMHIMCIQKSLSLYIYIYICVHCKICLCQDTSWSWKFDGMSGEWMCMSWTLYEICWRFGAGEDFFAVCPAKWTLLPFLEAKRASPHKTLAVSFFHSQSNQSISVRPEVFFEQKQGVFQEDGKMVQHNLHWHLTSCLRRVTGVQIVVYAPGFPVEARGL